MALSLEDIDRLRKAEGKTVRLFFHDGEVATVELLHVDLEYNDVVCDLPETNRTERYRPLKGPAHAMGFDTIERFELVDEKPE